MKKVLLTHTDADGLGCWLVLYYFKQSFDKVFMCDYEMWESEENKKILFEYDHIICTDYSISTHLVKELLKANKVVEIYDHHNYDKNEFNQGLKELIHPNYKIAHDETKAGTLIVFEQFLPKNIRTKLIVKQFAVLCSTYDLYKTDDVLWEDALNLNRVLWGCVNWGATGIEKFAFIKDFWFNKLNNNNEWFWSDFEKKKIASAVASENKAYIEAKSTYKELIDEKGLKFGVFVVNKKVSITALKILNEKKNIDYVVVVNTYDGWGKLSLRSLEGKFDCTKIANGHLCAAGIEVSQEDAIALYKGTKNLPYKRES